MSRLAVLAVSLFMTSCSFAQSALPPTAPPPDVCHSAGVTYCALNLAVTDDNVQQTICNPSWTAGLRPPLGKTNAWKSEILQAYNLPGTIVDYEGDHRMPEAALGGDPGAYYSGHGSRASPTSWILTDQTTTLPTGIPVPSNFSDESPPSPNSKDTMERNLGLQVCHRKKPFLGLTEARQLLIQTWLGPYPTFKT